MHPHATIVDPHTSTQESTPHHRSRTTLINTATATTINTATQHQPQNKQHCAILIANPSSSTQQSTHSGAIHVATPSSTQQSTQCNSQCYPHSHPTIINHLHSISRARIKYCHPHSYPAIINTASAVLPKNEEDQRSKEQIKNVNHHRRKNGVGSKESKVCIII